MAAIRILRQRSAYQSVIKNFGMIIEFVFGTYVVQNFSVHHPLWVWHVIIQLLFKMSTTEGYPAHKSNKTRFFFSPSLCPICVLETTAEINHQICHLKSHLSTAPPILLVSPVLFSQSSLFSSNFINFIYDVLVFGRNRLILLMGFAAQSLFKQAFG